MKCHAHPFAHHTHFFVGGQNPLSKIVFWLVIISSIGVKTECLLNFILNFMLHSIIMKRELCVLCLIGSDKPILSRYFNWGSGFWYMNLTWGQKSSLLDLDFRENAAFDACESNMGFKNLNVKVPFKTLQKTSHFSIWILLGVKKVVSSTWISERDRLWALVNLTWGLTSECQSTVYNNAENVQF